MDIKQSFTFDDVLLVPGYSDILPDEHVSTETFLTKGIKIKKPFVSAAMDTVTWTVQAIAMAKNGCIGILHRNCSIEEQVSAVTHVKRHQSTMVTDPLTLSPDMSIKEATEFCKKFDFTTILVVDPDKKLLGLVSSTQILDFSNEPEKLIREIMKPFSELYIAYGDTSPTEAREIMKRESKKRLPIIRSEEDRTLIGLYFRKDIDNLSQFPDMSVDQNGALRVGAAIGVGDAGFERAEALIKANVDVLCIDVAQGHSKGVIDILKRIKAKYPKSQIIAGNVVTKSGAQALIDAGADAVKVGVGPGAICTTREKTGNGMPQLTAIMNVYEATKAASIPLIADGGIKVSGDIAKAIAAGASTIMMGSVFAGTNEAPGDKVDYKGVPHMVYRGMGSKEAMAHGIAGDRYGDKSLVNVNKKIEEGVSGYVPCKGPVKDVIEEYHGALVQSMRVYQGARTIIELQTDPEFCQTTQQGRIESGTRVLTS